MVHKFISTASGRAKLIKVIKEDKNGQWDDHWKTVDGYWVIHDGNRHYVYEVV